MDEKCPLYLQSSDCTLKVLSNPRIVSFLLKQDIEVLQDKWTKDCEGLIKNCSFFEQKQEEKVLEETSQVDEPQADLSTKISI